MKCPNCHAPLSSGEAYFKKSGVDFLASGQGAEDLRMRRDSGEDFILLAPAEKAAALFCDECGVVVLATGRGKVPAAKRIRS